MAMVKMTSAFYCLGIVVMLSPVRCEAIGDEGCSSEAIIKADDAGTSCNASHSSFELLQKHAGKMHVPAEMHALAVKEEALQIGEDDDELTKQAKVLGDLKEYFGDKNFAMMTKDQKDKADAEATRKAALDGVMAGVQSLMTCAKQGAKCDKAELVKGLLDATSTIMAACSIMVPFGPILATLGGMLASLFGAASKAAPVLTIANIKEAVTQALREHSLDETQDWKFPAELAALKDSVEVLTEAIKSEGGVQDILKNAHHYQHEFVNISKITHEYWNMALGDESDATSESQRHDMLKLLPFQSSCEATCDVAKINPMGLDSTCVKGWSDIKSKLPKMQKAIKQIHQSYSLLGWVQSLYKKIDPNEEGCTKCTNNAMKRIQTTGRRNLAKLKLLQAGMEDTQKACDNQDAHPLKQKCKADKTGRTDIWNIHLIECNYATIILTDCNGWCEGDTVVDLGESVRLQGAEQTNSQCSDHVYGLENHIRGSNGKTGGPLSVQVRNPEYCEKHCTFGTTMGVCARPNVCFRPVCQVAWKNFLSRTKHIEKPPASGPIKNGDVVRIKYCFPFEMAGVKVENVVRETAGGYALLAPKTGTESDTKDTKYKIIIPDAAEGTPVTIGLNDSKILFKAVSDGNYYLGCSMAENLIFHETETPLTDWYNPYSFEIAKYDPNEDNGHNDSNVYFGQRLNLFSQRFSTDVQIYNVDAPFKPDLAYITCTKDSEGPKLSNFNSRCFRLEKASQ